MAVRSVTGVTLPLGVRLTSNPCLTCGACCAYYAVTFYWAEADDTDGGTVPAGLTAQHGPFQRVMRRTESPSARCVALEGEVGGCVRCTIYTQRPSVCRDFEYSWQSGKPSELCDRARAAHGLPPLPASGMQQC